jgi:hypothetical protein
LGYQFTELALNVDDFGNRELELYNGHTGGFEMSEETDFGGLKEEKGAAFSSGTSCGSTNTVDVVGGVVRGVKLNYPVYVGDLSGH